jgi:site-specific recombinase XerD
MATGSIKVNFNLRDASASTPTPINLVIRYNNQKLVYPTSEHIVPKNWQSEKTKKGYQRAKPNSWNDYSELNARLDNIEHATKSVFRKFLNDNEHILPTPKALKELLDIEFKRTSAPAKNLIAFVKNFIETSKTRKHHKNGKTISGRTIKKYQTTLNHLLEYSKQVNSRIDFNDITVGFKDNYIQFLNGKNLAVNTIAKDISVIKEILNSATEAGLNKNLQYKNKKFSAPTEISDSIYLNKKEIKLLFDLDLKNNKTLDAVRDLFIIGCNTGLRFSDLSVLNQNHIKDEMIEIEMCKTGDKVVIPMNDMVKAIFAKHDNCLPRRFSNQKTNQYLKEIGEKIDELKPITEKKITKGGKRQTMKCEKYKLITTHTARRSFATNLFLDGFPPISIMCIAGHRTESAFMRYIKITPTDTAKNLAKFWDSQIEKPIASINPNKDQIKRA